MPPLLPATGLTWSLALRLPHQPVLQALPALMPSLPLLRSLLVSLMASPHQMQLSWHQQRLLWKVSPLLRLCLQVWLSLQHLLLMPQAWLVLPLWVW